MSIELSAMSAQDYDQVRALWNRCDGLSQGDARPQVEQLLQYHPGLSLVARRQGEVVAAVLAG